MDVLDIPSTKKKAAKSVAKYMLLPGIFPRLKNLGFSVGRIFFVFTQILGYSKLIDKDHPCLKKENIGKYKFTEVLFLAWKNVKLDVKHLPQTMMFFAVIASIIVIAGIFLSASGYLASNLGGAAHAQYFGTPTDTGGVDYKTQNDWAFTLLERIFGNKQQTGVNFWIQDSTIPMAQPWFTSIFVGMLKTYSKALMFLAVFMILYILITALADAARSGKPFGEKFDPVWAPIRFALALGLLAPLSGSGYNGAQLLVFQSAEWGSNLATNLWIRGVNSAQKESTAFIGATVSDPGYRFVRDMFLINLCVTGFNQMIDDKTTKDYTKKIKTEPRISSDGKNKTYSFGNDDAVDFCGVVVVPDVDQFQKTPAEFTKLEGNQQGFFPNVLADNYNTALADFMPSSPGNVMAKATIAMSKNIFCDRNKKLTELECDDVNCTSGVSQWIYTYWLDVLGRDVDDPSQDYFFAAYEQSLTAYNQWLYDGLKRDAAYGWASSGAFYLRMSYALSMLDDVVNSPPHVSKLPTNFYETYSLPGQNITNDMVKAQCKSDSSQEFCKESSPAALLYNVLHKAAAWFEKAPKMSTPSANNLAFFTKVDPQEWTSSLHMTDKEGYVAPSMGDVMGPVSRYLYEKIKIGSSTLNPLGQVIGWGSGLVHTAEWCFNIAIAASVVGLFVAGAAMQAISTIAMGIGKALIVPGFILMFIVPLMPFLYFTFAVIEWITAIIEAIIGIPLWALTFITAEGDLGSEATDGAKILFEIVLRPTITVMSLLGSIIIFTASVSYFNGAIQIYMDSASNGSGAVSIVSSIVSGFAMIFIYMFAVYALATSCFKMIDAIPSNFGRWLAMSEGFGQMTDIGGKLALSSGFVASQGVDFAVAGVNAVKAPVQLGINTITKMGIQSGLLGGTGAAAAGAGAGGTLGAAGLGATGLGVAGAVAAKDSGADAPYNGEYTRNPGNPINNNHVQNAYTHLGIKDRNMDDRTLAYKLRDIEEGMKAEFASVPASKVGETMVKQEMMKNAIRDLATYRGIQVEPTRLQKIFTERGRNKLGNDMLDRGNRVVKTAEDIVTGRAVKNTFSTVRRWFGFGRDKDKYK